MGQYLGNCVCVCICVIVYCIGCWLTGGPANPGAPAGPTSPRSPCGQHAASQKDRLWCTYDAYLIFTVCQQIIYGEYGKTADVCHDEGSHSYLQRLHELQLGQKVRRNRSHPGGQNSECFIISLALFHPSIHWASFIHVVNCSVPIYGVNCFINIKEILYSGCRWQFKKVLLFSCW